MQPQSFLTLRFVKILLLILLGAFLLIVFVPGSSRVMGRIFLILMPIAAIGWTVLNFSFPKTKVTANEEHICFKRDFPSWHPFKKYYLHELIIPHAGWDNWIKVIRSPGQDTSKDYYLFFKEKHLRYVVQESHTGNLEPWVKKNFPDRPLETKRPFLFEKYEVLIDNLKERNRMRVF